MTKKPSVPVLSTDIYMALKERIIGWEYPPKFRITEEDLCEEFGVSRSPVREALRRLVENALVEKEPHRGYTVRQPDLNEIESLYEVRLALELYVVEKLARQGMQEDTWQRMYDTWTTLCIDINAADREFASYDEEFHEVLATATGNVILAQQLKSVDERLHFVRLYDITSPERLKITCKQHLQILECIHSGNVECAKEAMEMNILDGRQHVAMALREALARAYMGLTASGQSSNDLSNP